MGEGEVVVGNIDNSWRKVVKGEQKMGRGRFFHKIIISFDLSPLLYVCIFFSFFKNYIFLPNLNINLVFIIILHNI